MSSSGWGNFWKDQRQSFYAVMQIATGYFAVQLEKRFQVKPSHDILDYGCGPGFVADSLAAKKITTTGVDINEYFIQQCRINHPASAFIHITTDTAENERILHAQLKEQKFDFIILLSVAQYLKSTSELEAILKMLRSYLKEQGKIIIADVIDQNTSSAKDALSLLTHCVKKGRIGAFIGFISYLLFSNYRKISKETKMLELSGQSICEIAANNHLNYEKVNGLTIHPTRNNYVLSKAAQ